MPRHLLAQAHRKQHYSLGLLFVHVMGADNSYVDASAVNANCQGNTTTSGSTEEHQGGKIYLAMQAAGDWSVEVQIPK